MTAITHPSDLTEAPRAKLHPVLGHAQEKLGRSPADPRPLINGILHVGRGGIPGRFLRRSCGPRQTVSGTFRRWRLPRLWRALNDQWRACVRHGVGRRWRPTGRILDSQTVRSAAHGGAVGYDAAKKTRARKRHLLSIPWG